MLGQHLNQAQRANPRELLWLHQTISPSFSQGGPDPRNPGQKLPGEHIKKVADNLKDKPQLAEEFPPLKVFTLDDPDTGLTHTYSLSNRRLTAFRLGNVESVRVQPATDEEVMTSLWKMTSRDGGFSQPQMTMANKDNNSLPNVNSTLGKFRAEMERQLFVYERYCAANNIVGQEMVQFVTENMSRVARIQFHRR